MKYTICNHCGIVIMYNDTSSATPSQLQTIDNFLKVSGLLVYVDHEENASFTCDCCGGEFSNDIARNFLEA